MEMKNVDNGDRKHWYLIGFLPLKMHAQKRILLNQLICKTDLERL